jgi:hypothetical protein
MKYKVLTPLAQIGKPYMVGDLIEISDKAEAERMIAANIVAPLKVERGIRVETADLKPVGVEKAATHVAATPDAGASRRPARAAAKTGRKKR